MRQWLDKDSTFLVVEHDNGIVTVATRPEPGAMWGPPVILELDRVFEAHERRRREAGEA